jgi:hypothetical protein
MTDCLFCSIVAGEIPAEVVAEDERTITFMDISPATRGHALVIPRAHARDLYEISALDLAAKRGRRVDASRIFRGRVIARAHSRCRQWRRR